MSATEFLTKALREAGFIVEKPEVIKGGDIVRLKSGGPKMTVQRRAVQSIGWQCSWFNDNYNSIQTGEFSDAALEK